MTGAINTMTSCVGRIVGTALRRVDRCQADFPPFFVDPTQPLFPPCGVKVISTFLNSVSQGCDRQLPPCHEKDAACVPQAFTRVVVGCAR
jgi:hypothetical protein